MMFAPEQSNRPTAAAQTLQGAANAANGRQAGTRAQQGGNGNGETG